MLKSFNLLIDRVGQCLTVLTNIYNLLSQKQLQLMNRELALSESKLSKRSASITEVEDGEELLTISEACDICGVSRGTLKARREEGMLPEVCMGERGVRFRRADVEMLRKWYSIGKGKV